MQYSYLSTVVALTTPVQLLGQDQEAGLYTGNDQVSPENLIYRSGAVVFNNSTAVMTLLLGPATSLSSTAFTTQVPAMSPYTVPSGWIAQVSAMWATATGSAVITELF